MIFRPFNYALEANIIASFYEQEWKIPQERTLQNLNSSNVVEQLVVMDENQIIATGGLYKKVGIHQEGNFDTEHPWLALMYVKPSHRRKGMGTQLLAALENQALQKDFAKLCLFTRDQQQFYERNNWVLDEQLALKGQAIFLMHKILK